VNSEVMISAHHLVSFSMSMSVPLMSGGIASWQKPPISPVKNIVNCDLLLIFLIFLDLVHSVFCAILDRCTS